MYAHFVENTITEEGEQVMITFRQNEKYCRWNGVLMDEPTCKSLFGIEYDDLCEGETYYYYLEKLYIKTNFSKREVLKEFFSDFEQDVQPRTVAFRLMDDKNHQRCALSLRWNSC